MSIEGVKFEPWMLSALGGGVESGAKEALIAQDRDYLVEQKAKYDEQVAREEERKSSMMWGGGLGGLLGLGVLTLATGGVGGLMAAPSLAWGTAAGLGGLGGAALAGWSGESAEGLSPGLFEQHDWEVAEDEYYDRLRSGILDTGLTTGLLGYGAGNVAKWGMDKLMAGDFMDFAAHGTPNTVPVAPSTAPSGAPSVVPPADPSFTPPVNPLVPDVRNYASSLLDPSLNNPFIRRKLSNELSERSYLPPGLISGILGGGVDPLELWMASQNLGVT